MYSKAIEAPPLLHGCPQGRPGWREAARVSSRRAFSGYRDNVDLERGTVESDGLTDGPAGHLFGRIPENLLGGVQSSPQRVASNIRGFFANRFSGALPDTGCPDPPHPARDGTALVPYIAVRLVDPFHCNE